MPDIVLATLNAKYIHASFGLRYLMANLGEDLRPRAVMAEFIINQQPLEIVEAILGHEPRIVGFGVYIWNVVQTTEVVGLLKRIKPGLIVVLGGPEVSYETVGQPIVDLADHVITGEADVKFGQLCRLLLGEGNLTASIANGGATGGGAVDGAVPAGEWEAPVSSEVPVPKILMAELPPLNQLATPYDLYTDEDLAHRVIYVEASRGCPFTCEFCLSSLDIPVRAFALPAFLESMQRLLDRGATQFKFVDRTFNLHLPTSSGILQFFLDRWREGLFLHFEMVPDRLPEQLRSLIRQFPAGAVQFEVGIQTFDDLTSKNISRRQNYDRLADNFRFLRQETGVHIHADLIVGLPGESVESFGRGFDRLVRMGPQEIQVGILKRLRGTPIVRHDAEYQMVYSPNPPYEILSTRDISFPEMQRMRRFARYWDLVANSGQFAQTLPLLWGGAEGVSVTTAGQNGLTSFSDAAGPGAQAAVNSAGSGASFAASPLEADRLKVSESDSLGAPLPRSASVALPPAENAGGLISPFTQFCRFAEYLHRTLRRTHQIALPVLAQSLFDYLTNKNENEHAVDPQLAASTLTEEWNRVARRETLILRGVPTPPVKVKPAAVRAARRQARHTQVG